jgi:nucleotide-binding universal stress UspA family protein
MTYRDLLVVLDAGPRTRERVGLAARLAERFAAHLVGLHVTIGPETTAPMPWSSTGSLGPIAREIERKNRAEAEEARRLFEDVTGRYSLSAEWRTASGDPDELAAVHGHYADLIVLGQHDPDEAMLNWVRPRPEVVALSAGRPILVVPYAGAFSDTGRRVLIGWDAGREATRAVNDAMPLLAGADSVTVLTIDPRIGGTAHGELPGADIALHLSRHGVVATVERTASSDIDPGNVLLSRASDLSADLLVIGAYGHSRLRELLLGGVTRTMLASMTLPVLMAH